MRKLKITFQTLGFAVLIALSLVFFLPSRTPEINGENSIATIEKLHIGGIDQYVMIRGADLNKPIVLFLHGGPGYSQISYARKYQSKLEQNFIVVNWDQRGSGKSYSSSIDKETMTLDQFVADTNELLDYLLDTFGKERLYLVGHSWGSELGMYVALKYPQKLYSFISIGQLVDGKRNEELSYDYTLKMAESANNTKAIEELKQIGRPPYKDIVSDMMIQRKWLKVYGGLEIGCNTYKDMILASIFSPEYSGIDGIKLAIGSKFTADLMFPHIFIESNLMKDIPEVKVPVYFCVGRNDHNTPHQLIEEYYNKIKAPSKELIWFEESAHFPNFEEPELFAETLLEISQNTIEK